MTIKFVCICGKRLRAREEMAGRRSMCPRCGKPVGIPFLQPTHRGAPWGPLSAVESRRARLQTLGKRDAPAEGVPLTAAAGLLPDSFPNQEDSPAEAASAQSPRGPLDLGLIQWVAGQKKEQGHGRRRRRWQFETHWYECLLCPLRAWPLVIGLAAALTGLTGVTVLLWPGLLELLEQPLGQVLARAPGLLVPLLIAGYACDLLEYVLTAALAGEVGVRRWPGRNVAWALKSAVTWLFCFLAGPAVLAVAAFFFWLYCGDLAPVDWLILAEMGILAVGYWLFTLLALFQDHRLRDVNPARVAELFHRLGYRSVLATLLASALLAAHGLWGLAAVEKLHGDAVLGWLLLGSCWLSGMFFATFFFRLLGVWCYRCRSAPITQEPLAAP